MVLEQRMLLTCVAKPCRQAYRPNWSKCDRCILNLVRQSLIHADGSIPTLNEEQQILTRLKQIFDRLGAIIVTSEGQIQFMTQRAEQLLNKYFSTDAPNSLPEALKCWFEHQISRSIPNKNVSCSSCPLHIEQAGKGLSVNLIADLVGDQYLVLLQEGELESFSISSLELIGLTKREAEVLFWVAKDKSNAEIAKVLGCSKGTVRKHLEHIHAKLNVQTRTAAVMVALERLGILKEPFVAMSS